MKTIIKLASDLRSILEKDHSELDSMGFPFIGMFPRDCCRGASVFLGLITNKFYPKYSINIIQGTTLDRYSGHYWVEINSKVYDITIDQFLSWDDLKQQYPIKPVYAQDVHPLNEYFCHKIKYSHIEAFSFYCSEVANLKNVIAMYDVLLKKLKELGWA